MEPLSNTNSAGPEKQTDQDVAHVEYFSAYERVDEEPELHAPTYVAIAAMCMLNMVQTVALQSPPVVLSVIGADLNNASIDTWIPNALSLVQAVLAPLLASASDTFQARKTLLVVFTLISFIGAAIAPGAQSIGRLIAAQVLIGFGFATVPLAYCIPSEILPRKWRPMAQSVINVAAVLGACAGPLMIGALTRDDPHTGWRNFYWIQMALWGVTSLGILIGYRPPQRHTRYDHLTVWQKIGKLDLLGFAILTVGLTLFLVALNLGGEIYAWTSGPVLSTLIIGMGLMFVFGVYEWRFTKTGMLNHDMFRGENADGRTLAICIALIFIEGIMLFAYIIFYPVLTSSLVTTNPFLDAARAQPYWIAAALSTVIYGYASSKIRDIRPPLFVGFLVFTAGVVSFATIQPGDSTRSVIFAGLSGIGFGAPLILIITGVQLVTPHSLIATATAITTCSRAISSTIFTAIYTTAFSRRLKTYMPQYISIAVLQAGLPPGSVPAFVQSLAQGSNATALSEIPGVTPAIISAGLEALKQAYADAVRIIWIIAAPFGVVACVACFFIRDLKKTMNYRVDAPLEQLTAKNNAGNPSCA